MKELTSEEQEMIPSIVNHYWLYLEKQLKSPKLGDIEIKNTIIERNKVKTILLKLLS